jgi:hypothetical protein
VPNKENKYTKKKIHIFLSNYHFIVNETVVWKVHLQLSSSLTKYAYFSLKSVYSNESPREDEDQSLLSSILMQ